MTSRADLPVEKFGLFLPMETRQAVSGAQAGGALLVPIGAALPISRRLPQHRRQRQRDASTLLPPVRNVLGAQLGLYRRIPAPY
jgi:hypothetical protein